MLKVLHYEEVDVKLPKVKEVSLLTKEEFEKYWKYIGFATGDSFFGDERRVPNYFYLMDAVDKNTVYVADGSGDYDESEVSYDDFGPDNCGKSEYGTGTRPVIRFAEAIPGVKEGDKIAIRGDLFTVLAPDIVLSDMYISREVFDKRTSNYAKSAIKKRIDKWYAGLLEEGELEAE